MRTCVLSFLLLLALHSFGCSCYEPPEDSLRHKRVLILTVDTLRPELVHPLRARAEAREALGDREGGAADRDLARRQAERSRLCAHTDPFRYQEAGLGIRHVAEKQRRLRPAGGTPSDVWSGCAWYEPPVYWGA